MQMDFSCFHCKEMLVQRKYVNNYENIAIKSSVICAFEIHVTLFQRKKAVSMIQINRELEKDYIYL